MNTTPTLNELVYTVLNSVRSRVNTDENLSEEYIKFLVKSIRAELIKQEANKGYTIDSYITQTLSCLNLKLVDSSECCDTVTGCTILRTVQQIPSIIELSHSQAITRIGAVNQTDIPFDLVDYSKVPYLSFNKYAKNRIKCYLKDNDGYMYFVVPKDHPSFKLLKKVTLNAVFEDPEQLKNFKDCSGKTCYSDNQSFPIKFNMVKTLTQMVIDKFIRPASVSPIDNTNDNKLNLEQLNG